MSIASDHTIDAVTIPSTVWPKTSFSLCRPVRCAITVGINNTLTTASSSQYGPTRKASGKAE